MGDRSGPETDFITAMGHLYRGEVSRANFWLSRMDATQNWAIIIVATLLTWAFSSRENPHYVILIGMVMVSLLLVIEARRYTYYDVWRSRVRILEKNFFSPLLEEGKGSGDWKELLAQDLKQPAIKISSREAIVRRLRRIYIFILLVLLVSWAIKILVFTDPSRFPGILLLSLVGAYYAFMLGIALWPMERKAMGELREDEEYVEEWQE